MVEEEGEPPTRPEHPAHLGDGLVDRLYVLEDQAGHHGVKGGVAERKVVGTCTQVGRATSTGHGREDLRRRGIHAHDRRRSQAGRQAADLALPGPHVQNSVVTGQQIGGQRKYLLGVLGVGAICEAVLPPSGVFLPRVRVRGVIVHRLSLARPGAERGHWQAAT